jgi:hypothetical protein
MPQLSSLVLVEDGAARGRGVLVCALGWRWYRDSTEEASALA